MEFYESETLYICSCFGHGFNKLLGISYKKSAKEKMSKVNMEALLVVWFARKFVGNLAVNFLVMHNGFLVYRN